MATEKRLLSETRAVAADYSSNQYYLMTLNTSDQWELCSTAGEACVGALMNDPTATQNGQVCMAGLGKVKAGGTVAQWDRLVTDANGKAVAATDATDASFGFAMVSGVSNDVITYSATPAAAADAALKTFQFSVDAADIADGDILTDWTPGFIGTITSFDAVCEKAITTAAKASDLDLEIGAVAITGGQVALAGVYALGEVQAGAAITAGNTFTATDTISIVASSTTTFIEGRVSLVITLSQAL